MSVIGRAAPVFTRVQIVALSQAADTLANMTADIPNPIGPTATWSQRTGRLTEFHMPEPIVDDGFGYRVEVYPGQPWWADDATEDRDVPFITLRGADIREEGDRNHLQARTMEITVRGKNGWGDDENDRIYVAALQIAPITQEFTRSGEVMVHGYMGEPGGTDYTDFDTLAQKPEHHGFPFWPTNREGAHVKVADRLRLPTTATLVRVRIQPESKD